ncbi:trypsin-like serine peptidase [Streptomyces orinoci]|uniref:Trypsin-like peptidase domain-containing protein n=1 Tax=Streptomyces orinoci TaxID=67339 RepID=A0ABV3K138_STRON|nr:trypsin-like peptidase domain-containing protein [Streptomyces orinoci]
MRLNAGGPRRAGLTVLIATVVALAVVGLLVATHGAATDEPLAQGESSGHYREPAGTGRATDEAMRSAVRVRTGTERPTVPQAADREAPHTDPLPASKPLAAREMSPSPAIGPLFYTGQGDPGHGCTASVVHSPTGDLLVTAAHCVHQNGFHTDIAFVPGYHDGVAPYGVWVPTAIDVAPEWISDRDEDHDVAFLHVRQVGSATPIERVTGAERIAFRPSAPRPARVLGYPSDSETPLGCQNATRMESATQLRFDCEGLPSGTSGSPVLTDVDPGTGLGTVNGVLGGKDEGGDDETSYSSYFGDDVRALYERATK